ncbi:hypothetical protein [Phenylobacterium sp.]|uniref:hypothetical protein n=1 Tax=Phenylobacterium sp. TaxID=1871053 RepID=UPI0025EEFB28|nr:hypothetical protein [Phenylobacterium sp.]MBX3483016.1 hypothetical protein [Phenylobacterium sp.]
MSAALPGMTLTRIAAADATALLERLSGSDRLERGAVFVLSVEAIRDLSGERWARKRDDVWGYLGRKLNEYLSYQDVHQRINDTDVLVAMTTEDGIAAQAVGMKVLEEVLEFFLGAAERKDIRIKAVSRIDGEELVCADLDPEIIAVAREKEAAHPYQRQVSPEAEKARNPVSFVAHNGQRLEVAFALEHIVNLRHGVTAVLRVEPTVAFVATGETIQARKFRKLSDEDMIAIDRASLAFAALFTPKDARTQPPVIVPCSFRTMGVRKGRDLLLNIEGLTPERVRQGVMLEFVDIDRGAPNGRVVEVVSLVARLTRGVVARLQPGANALEPIAGARFNGLTVDFADLGLPDTRLGAVLRAMAHQIRGKAPALIAQGLAERLHYEMADDAGFTHAGLRAAPNTVSQRQVA